MRILSFGWLALTLLCWGCQPESSAPVRLTLELADSTLAPLVLVPASEKVSYREYQAALDTLPLQPDGTYTFEWTADTAAFYHLYSGKGNFIMYPFYLAPGDSLIVTNLDPDSMVTYEGAGASFYPFYEARDRLAWGDSLMKAQYDQRYKMEPDSFRKMMTHRLEKLMAVYDEYAQTPDLPAALLEYGRQSIIYPYARVHYDYLEYHNYYTQDTFLYLYPDSSYFSFEPVPSPDPATFSVADDYTQLVAGRIQKRYHDEIRGLPDSVQWEQTFPGKWKIVQGELEGIDRDFGLLALADDFTFYLDREDFFPTLQEMQTFSEEQHLSATLHRKFKYRAEKMKSLAPGQPAPDLILPGLDGQEVSLSDFQGKIVYLDFWGTWCYPCLQELPHSLELEEEFGEEEVAFVYVALEYDSTDQERWRQFVTGEKALDYAPFLEQRVYPGVHLLAEGQFNNPAIKPYLVNYAPTYVLIDQEGKIVKPRAPRPSSGEELKTLLRGLMENK
jgi:thiol-disulfide isomerase/thioredoxin